MVVTVDAKHRRTKAALSAASTAMSTHVFQEVCMNCTVPNNGPGASHLNDLEVRAT